MKQFSLVKAVVAAVIVIAAEQVETVLTGRAAVVAVPVVLIVAVEPL